MEKPRPFNGRVIFDHLPKTGGQAVNAWLTNTLGTGTVTTNLIGEHRALIRRYGGAYAVISGHLSFQQGGWTLAISISPAFVSQSTAPFPGCSSP